MKEKNNKIQFCVKIQKEVKKMLDLMCVKHDLKKSDMIEKIIQEYSEVSKDS